MRSVEKSREKLERVEKRILRKTRDHLACHFRHTPGSDQTSLTNHQGDVLRNRSDLGRCKRGPSVNILRNHSVVLAYQVICPHLTRDVFLKVYYFYFEYFEFLRAYFCKPLCLENGRISLFLTHLSTNEFEGQAY